MDKVLRYILTVANVATGLTWVYHGLVPKLMHMETGELATMKGAGITALQGIEQGAVYAVGIGEILFGLAFVFAGKYKALHYLNIAGLLILGTCAFAIRANVYLQPFNPATTSFGAIGLSLIVLKIRQYVPIDLHKHDVL